MRRREFITLVSAVWALPAQAQQAIPRIGYVWIGARGEQSHDKVGDPTARDFMVNVASYQHGVGYRAWTKVDGFSEAVIAWIAALEETMH